MDLIEQLYELYLSFLKMADHTSQSHSYTEFREKLLQQYTMEELQQHGQKRIDSEEPILI